MRIGRSISIRISLTLWYSGVFVFGLILFAISVWVLLRQGLYDDLQKQLAGRTRSLQAFIENESKEPGIHLSEELEEYSRGLPEGTYFWFYDDRNNITFSSNPSFQPPPRFRMRQYAPWKLWIQPSYLLSQASVVAQGRTYRIEGAISARETLAILRQLRILLMTLMPIVVLIASFGGLLLSRRALKPVDEITGAARLLSINDLSVRLPVFQTGDELQRLSETWNSMLDRLQSAVERLSRFTQDASHELRTPLAIIRSTAEIASRRSRSEQSYRDAFGQIVEESDRLTALVEDLLLLARGDGAPGPKFERVNLRDLLADVCREMEVLAQNKAVRLECEIVGKPFLMKGNLPLLRRLMVVLVDNAIKYSPNGSTIVLGAISTLSFAQIHVTDRGLGIDTQELAHIFERFYRGEAAREAWSNGAGLGLSLAASIARQHNATIAVRSEPKRGSIFTVTFPAPTLLASLND